jgi:hypothetical protein
MPLSPPSAFSAVSSAAGLSGVPSSETGSPFSKPISTIVTSSGASSGESVR